MFVQQSQESDFVSENVIWLGTSEPELVIVHSLKVPIIEKLQPQPPPEPQEPPVEGKQPESLIVVPETVPAREPEKLKSKLVSQELRFTH